MPADRDPHTAFGQPTGLWPGQDISRQSGSPALPWPEAEAPPAARAEFRGDLPWPDRELPDHNHPEPLWSGPDQGWPGPDRGGADWAPDGPGSAAGWGPPVGPASHDGTAWTGPTDSATWAGPTDRTGWTGPTDGATWAGPADSTGWTGPADSAAWGQGATATATLTGPPLADAPAEPRSAGGGPGRPPHPPVTPGPPPGGSRPRWRMMVAAAVTLAVASGGVAVAALRPDATNPQAGEVPAAGQPKPSAGLGAPAKPGSAPPSAAQGLGGKPDAKASASAAPGVGRGFGGTRLTLPGASIGVQNGESFGQALSRSDRTFGKLQMARIFYPGLPPAWSGSRSDVVDRTVVVSFKAAPQEINSGKHDSRLASWFASIPRDHNVYWSYFHEPEDDVERGAFTPDAYRTAWKRVAGLAARANNPKLINTLILMCWTLDPKSKRSFDSYYPGGDVIETLGWDCYNWGKKWNRYAPPQEIYGAMISKSKALGKPWGVAETGSDLVPGDSGTGRATWIRSMTGYLNGQRPEFVAYYNQTVSQGDFRLLDQPSIQAWKAFCVA
ncbi:hypothetical protein O7602_29905 [Micromonospora sp. WMMD1128]|uniref:hypothetical protein n=1 Tax=Micromonospora sp. WMMD1128 TaxID=3015150 RepID=UPI00248BAD4A|nr:hypothetical protein [Micromonospora sp. WMMD1128]WBB73817.1 hypothetical protein O7602_29905 [Micromonospora sp. WMMD1128]